jgi:hypothetical protein
MVNARKSAFERKGYPLISWYLPADLLPSYAGHEAYEPRDIELLIWTPEQNLETPVVIDPVTGDIFEPDGEVDPWKRKDVKKQYMLHGVPLKDYPMFVTDREAVKDMIEEI